MTAATPDSRSHPPIPGEAGIDPHAVPPFAAEDEQTRWLFALNRMGIRPGLKRVRGLLEDLDHPEKAFRSLVVAGTNGKGTATRVLADLVGAAGRRTACFTSPHLLRVYERLTIGGEPVDKDVFADAVKRVRPLTEKHEASWFETLTAVSLEIAREAGVEVFCCETGLGGRLDASNALPCSAVLLTGIALDHQHILGATLPEIAAEKLGLLKPGVPLFAALPEELRGQAFAAAVAAGAPCHFLDELARIETNPGSWSLITREAVFADLPPLPAPPMVRSAALALLALDELSRDGYFSMPDDPAAVLSDVFLPGRYQRVLTGPDWIVDTAHNDQALTGALGHFTSRKGPGRRVVLFGGMHDKNIGADVGAALAKADLVVCAPVSLPRSRNRDELEALMREWGVATRVRVAADVGEALRDLAAELGPQDVVLASGSCYMVGEVLYRLGFRDLEQTRLPRDAGRAFAALAGADSGEREGGGE